MKIQEVRVTVGVTKNMGNYESLRADVTLAAVLAEDDDPSKSHRTLTRAANAALVRQLQHSEKEVADSLSGE